MQRVLTVGLTLLVSVAAVGAEVPIPQDHARMEQRRRERLEWNRRTTVGAYDRVGTKDPRWDKPAREALDRAALMFSQDGDPQVGLDDVHQPAQAAVDAGCNDPMLVYIYNRSLTGPATYDQDENIRRARESARGLAASPYPAIRRAIALSIAGNAATSARNRDDASRKQAEGDLDAALALLPESAAHDDHGAFWEDGWYDVLFSLIREYRALGVDAPAAYERVDAGVARVPDLKPLRLHLRGDFWHSYGWEARTQAFAPFVPRGRLPEAGGSHSDCARPCSNRGSCRPISPGWPRVCSTSRRRPAVATAP